MYTGLVEKKTFSLASLTTESGQEIKDIRIGYESYGTLNEAKDNVILIAHHYVANSHAAGRYKQADPAPGFWDSIVGPGQPFDTDRYFVICSDTLVNINANDPNTITTGPASINPDTGKHYAMSFPVITVRDMVRVQKALLDHLGVRKLVAAAGPSSGANQALQWATDYPDMVPRVIAVVSPGISFSAHSICALGLWTMPLQVDQAWNGGNYYGGPGPQEGLKQSLKLMSFSASSFDTLDTIARKWSQAKANPLSAPSNRYLAETFLYDRNAPRAALIDPNSMIYMTRAQQLFSISESLENFRAKVLFIPVSTDSLFPPALSHRAAEQLTRAGIQADVFVLESRGGHVDGVLQIALAADPIRKFLAT